MEDARSESKASPTGRSLVRCLSPGLRQTAAHSSTSPSGAALAGRGGGGGAGCVCVEEQRPCSQKKRHINGQGEVPCPEQRYRLLGCLGAQLL